MGDGSSVPSGSSPEGFEPKESPLVTGGQESGEVTGVRDTGSAVQSQSTAGFVTSSDSAELDSHVDAYNSELDVDVDSPTPGEFARQAFTTGAQSRRVNAGFDGHAANFDSDDALVGGWNSFSFDDVRDRVGLSDAEVGAEGVNAGDMSVVDLESSGDRATDTAYVQEFTPDDNGFDIEKAHNQMSTYAALDAMGVRVPRHALDTESKEIFVESVSRDGYDGEIADPEVLPSEYADKVDAEQFEDVMAANMIVGNQDIKGENVFVSEDGNVTTFDFDRVFGYEDLDQFHSRMSKAGLENTIDDINAARSESVSDLDTTADAVAERARELATQLHESGMNERIAAVVSEYDEFFEAEDSWQYGGADFIRSAEDRLRTNIEGWSDTA